VREFSIVQSTVVDH